MGYNKIWILNCVRLCWCCQLKTSDCVRPSLSIVKCDEKSPSVAMQILVTNDAEWKPVFHIQINSILILELFMKVICMCVSMPKRMRYFSFDCGRTFHCDIMRDQQQDICANACNLFLLLINTFIYITVAECCIKCHWSRNTDKKMTKTERYLFEWCWFLLKWEKL